MAASSEEASSAAATAAEVRRDGGLLKAHRAINAGPSASRDEELFEDPDRFDVARPVEFHHAFGGGGRHFCLGAGLARLELRVIFEELVRRVGDLELAGEPQRLPSAWANGLTAMPVRFTPGPRVSDAP